MRLLLGAIVDSSDDAIISKDLDGRITTWNRGAKLLYGYTATEALGKPILMVIPPERHREEEEIVKRLRRGERIDHFETLRQRKDVRVLNVVNEYFGADAGGDEFGGSVTVLTLLFCFRLRYIRA